MMLTARATSQTHCGTISGSMQRASGLLKCCLAALLLINLGACSLMTVNLKSPPSSCDRAGTDDAKLCSTDEAIAYAARWRKTFMKAAGQHSVARNMNALIAFPAGAVGVFYGVTGHGSKDSIARLSIGTAAVYGATSYLAPQGKQRVYLEGALALSCVMDAALTVRRPGDRIKALTDQLVVVERNRSDVDALIGQFNGVLPQDSPSMARAAVARDNAINLLAHGYAIRDAHENAAQHIAFAVERIVTQTAILATNQESNLASLMAMVGDLRNTAGPFGLGALPAKSGGGEVKLQANSPDAILDTATDKLIESINALLPIIRELDLPESSADPYGMCKPVGPESGFKVIPAETAQSLKVDQSRDFSITNTQSNAYPTWSLPGGSTDAIGVEGPTVKGGKLIITVTGKKATGGEPLQFTISDPTGAIAKTYLITIIPADSAASAKSKQPKSPDKAAIPASFAGNFSADEIKSLQCHLGLVGDQSDGVIGDTTYSAIKSFAGKNKLAVGDVLSEKLFDEIVKSTEDHCSKGAP